MKIKRALLSVSDKTGIVELARFLNENGVEIISTGGTMNAIKEAGIPVTYVSDVTGFPEIMDGRVKTLNPKIHGAILAVRSNPEHMEALAKHEITPIDLVVVNLYPFRETVSKPGVTEAEAIENIDIGGPAMVRASAKNFKDVVIVTYPSRYEGLMAMLKETGDVDARTRKELALEAFSKELMAKYDIPTAFFKVCEDIETAKAYVEEKGAPIVVKADGLAAGKGVVVAMTKEEALEAIDDMMADQKFGNAGARVVLEEFMEGEEASLLAFTDGKTVIPMIAAQDHKRIFDNDEGPNTGGMGTYAPAPVMTDVLRLKATERVLKPVVAAMAQEGTPYQGCLYAGLMINGDSVKVVEFNCRFGDPETQVILPLLDGDLAEIMLACATGTLDEVEVAWHDKAAVCVVMASGGYPGSYENGKEITGLAEANSDEATVVFHAGTKAVDGKIVTAGGRVLGVTSVDKNIRDARDRAYAAVEKVKFDEVFYRKDIAWRALKR